MLTLWVESSLKTSLWEQVIFDRTGLGGCGGEVVPDVGSDLVKQEVKLIEEVCSLCWCVGVNITMKEFGRSLVVLWIEFVVLRPKVAGCIDIVCKLVKIDFLS